MAWNPKQLVTATALALTASFGLVEAASAAPKALIPTKAAAAPVAVAPQAAKAAKATRPAVKASRRVVGTRVIIPSIGLNRAVVVGKQAAIDAGNVVNYTGRWPGTGTVYLAGHNASHGAVFAKVGRIRVGATVTLWKDGKQYTYKIVSKQVISLRTKLSAVNWGDLVLQTCKNSTQAWLLRGKLVSVN